MKYSERFFNKLLRAPDQNILLNSGIIFPITLQMQTSFHLRQRILNRNRCCESGLKRQLIHSKSISNAHFAINLKSLLVVHMYVMLSKRIVYIRMLQISIVSCFDTIKYDTYTEAAISQEKSCLQQLLILKQGIIKNYSQCVYFQICLTVSSCEI